MGTGTPNAPPALRRRLSAQVIGISVGGDFPARGNYGMGIVFELLPTPAVAASASTDPTRLQRNSAVGSATCTNSD